MSVNLYTLIHMTNSLMSLSLIRFSHVRATRSNCCPHCISYATKKARKACSKIWDFPRSTWLSADDWSSQPSLNRRKEKTECVKSEKMRRMHAGSLMRFDEIWWSIKGQKSFPLCFAKWEGLSHCWGHGRHGSIRSSFAEKGQALGLSVASIWHVKPCGLRESSAECLRTALITPRGRMRNVQMEDSGRTQFCYGDCVENNRGCCLEVIFAKKKKNSKN